LYHHIINVYSFVLPSISHQKMFGKNKNTNNTSINGQPNRKSKPYRNRPSMRQTCLELLSFFMLFAAAPAFLGGTISIFICIFTLILGIIGLFAWTRRHAFLFAILAFLVICACIVNIILRATWRNGSSHGQCLPFFRYGGAFNNQGLFDPSLNPHQGDSNNYDQSIWCGNREIVYITNGIIIALAIPALVLALALLRRGKKNNSLNSTGASNVTQTTETKTYATS